MAKVRDDQPADEIKQVPLRLRLRVKCGSCWHLNGAKAPGFAAPCSKLGKSSTSASCDSYNANYATLREGGVQSIKDVGLLLKELPERMRHLIAYSIIQSGEMEKSTNTLLGETIHMGDQVMVNISCPQVDYLNCYFSSIALGVTPDRKGLICYSRINQKWVSCILNMRKGRIFTADAFKVKTKQLIKSGFINAPDRSLRFLLPTLPSVISSPYDPPSMVYADDTLIDGVNMGTRKSKTSKKNDAKPKRKALDRTFTVSESKHGKVISI